VLAQVGHTVTKASQPFGHPIPLRLNAFRRHRASLHKVVPLGTLIANAQ